MDKVDSTPSDGVLADAAWGRDPGRWPLQEGIGLRDRWYRAVALGGQGRYSAASAELDGVERCPELPRALRSLTASTRASWSRQMGRHVAASRYDGAAIALVGVGSRAADPRVTEARCDALTGLAADALGVGRFGAAEVFLSRCASELNEADCLDGLWRQRLRLVWVRSELAMVSGDGSAAVRHALDARELAAETVSLRHRTKTELIVAAAFSSSGDVERGRTTVSAVLSACSGYGLVPLRWAAAMLSNGLGEMDGSPKIIAECASLLARRGGVLEGK